jgi:putative ABC transport system permease protein
MFKTLNLLSIRSIKSRLTRTLLSLFGIILGVASIFAINTTNLNTLNAISKLFEDTSGKANLVILSSETTSEGIPEKIIRNVNAQPGVTAVVPSLQVSSMLIEEEAPEEISFSFFGAVGSGLSIFGIDPVKDFAVRDYTITKGRFLENDLNSYEIVLVEDFAAENEIEMGQQVWLQTTNGVETLKVVGLMSKEGPAKMNNGAFGIIPLQTAQSFFNSNNKITHIDITVHPNFASGDAIEIIKNSLQERVGPDYDVIFPANKGKRMSQMLSNYQIGLNFLSGIALFVGAFLIYNSFTMSVVERTREFGMLRTIGMTRSQIIRLVLIEALLLGLIGTALGIGLGYLMSYGLTQMMEVMLSQEITTTEAPISTYLTSVLVGIIVTIFSALVPAIQAGKTSPMEALRVRGKSKEVWLLREGWKLGAVMLGLAILSLFINPFPNDPQFRFGSMSVFSMFLGTTLLIPGSISVWERIMRPIIRRIYDEIGQFGSRNILRAKLRSTLTVAALMIGVAMVLVVQSMTTAFGGDLENWIESYIGGSLYVSSSLPMRENIERRIASVDGVEAIAPIRYIDVKWLQPDGKDEDISYMAVDPKSYTQVTSFVFSDSEIDQQAALTQLSNGQTVFISSVIAEKYGLSAGETLQLKTRGGIQTFDIAAVVVDYFNQGMVVQGSWRDMEQFFREREASTYLIRVDGSNDPNMVKEKIDKLYGKRYRLTIQSNQAIKDSINTLMTQAFSMFDILAMIAITVASLGVVNTLTMNVMERTREIGMLRSIGMTRSQIIRLLLAEAGLMGFIGGILGMLLGLLLAYIFPEGMKAMSGYSITFTIPVRGILIAEFLAVFISQIAALPPAFKAAKTPILEAIHFE